MNKTDCHIVHYIMQRLISIKFNKWHNELCFVHQIHLQKINNKDLVEMEAFKHGVHVFHSTAMIQSVKWMVFVKSSVSAKFQFFSVYSLFLNILYFQHIFQLLFSTTWTSYAGFCELQNHANCFSTGLLTLT